MLTSDISIFCLFLPEDLFKSGINILSTRQTSWRMCLGGRLVKVSTTLRDGCPQQVVSCVLMSGDVILAITINNWSGLLPALCYIVILTSSIWNKVVPGTFVIVLLNSKTKCFLNLVFHVGYQSSNVYEDECTSLS